MSQRTQIIRLLTIIFLTVMAFLLTSKDCRSEDRSRKGKTEIRVGGQYLGDLSESVSVSGLGSGKVESDGILVGGLGIGYNFNDYLNLNMKIWYRSLDFKLRTLGATFKGNADLFGGDINLDVNILKRRLTPVISGGVGFVQIDGDWSDGGENFSDTNFSYNVGAGFSWEIGDTLIIKALYGLKRLDLDILDTVTLDGPSLFFAFMF